MATVRKMYSSSHYSLYFFSTLYTLLFVFAQSYRVHSCIYVFMQGKSRKFISSLEKFLGWLMILTICIWNSVYPVD